MDLLGGAYDSDSEDESSNTPATSSNIASAPKVAPKPAQNNNIIEKGGGGSGKKRKVFGLGSLPTKEKPAKKRNIFADAGKDLDSDTPALAKQAQAAKSGVLRQQNFDDGTLLGALRSSVPEAAASSSKQKSQGPQGTLDVPKPSDLKKEREAKKKTSEFLTSIGQAEEGASSGEEEDDGGFFNLKSNKKELEEEAERQLLEDNTSSPEDDVGPIRPSDWSDAHLNQAFPDADDTLSKLMQSNQKLSDEEKRALAMGSNVVDFDPSQLQDSDWRRKQLAAELPGRPKYGEGQRKVTTSQYSVEDQGRVTTGVNKNQKRKHQIGWLAQTYADASYDLAQKEMDGAGKKHQTHQKYGW